MTPRVPRTAELSALLALVPTPVSVPRGERRGFCSVPLWWRRRRQLLSEYISERLLVGRLVGLLVGLLVGIGRVGSDGCDCCRPRAAPT